MTKQKQIMFTIFAVLFIALAISAYAQVTQPQLPHFFYGTAKVDSTDLPSGSVIIAKVSNVEKGRLTTTTGEYGGPSDSDDKLVVPTTGNIAENAQIEFFVSTVKANEVAQFKSTKIENKNLTWTWPDEPIEFDGPLANEPYTCMPGTDIEVTLNGLTVKIECDSAEAGTINNISILGTNFFIGAPAPGGVLNLSNALFKFSSEIS